MLLDTTMNISSFGEDEAGELYVVNLGGSLMRIASTAPPCTYGIAPTSQNFGAGAGTGSVAVTAGTGCAWTASPNASWLQVTSGGNGSGNGSVGYSVAANTGAVRTGTLTVAGQTFTVTQAAAPVACTYTISPASASYPAGGGAGNVTVNTAAGCPWTAVSNASWISLGASGGNGPGSVGYTVAQYTGKPKKRNGTVTIAGRTFSVQQTR